jgi:hypothetical protein
MPTFLEIEREFEEAIIGFKLFLAGEAEDTAGEDITRYFRAIGAYVKALRVQKQTLIDTVWEQHALWMSSFIPIAQREGFSADEFHKIMTDDERAKNRAFIDIMFPIMNPALEGTNEAARVEAPKYYNPGANDDDGIVPPRP